jgi:hypothetical protein
MVQKHQMNYKINMSSMTRNKIALGITQGIWTDSEEETESVIYPRDVRCKSKRI